MKKIYFFLTPIGCFAAIIVSSRFLSAVSSVTLSLTNLSCAVRRQKEIFKDVSAP